MLRFFSRLRLRIKFSLVILGLVIAILGGVLALLRSQQKAIILAKERSRCADLATVLAVASTRACLEKNFLVLLELVDSISNREGVREAMVLSPEGKVLVHNYTSEKNKIYSDLPWRRETLGEFPIFLTRRLNGENVIDVTVPVFVAGNNPAAFARVIVSLHNAEAAIEKITQEIYWIGAASTGVALLLAAFLSGLVTKPLRKLYHNAQQISRGARELQITVTEHDEIGTLQEALKTMVEEVRLRSRLSALGETMANLSHEIRSPLTAITRYIETAAKDGDAARYAERRQMVLGELSRLNDLVNQLLQFSQNRKLVLSRTNLNDLIEQALFLLDPLIQARRIQVQRGLEKLPPIAADKNLLQSVFMNLFSNAIEAMDMEGALRIQTRLIQAPPNGTVSGLAKKQASSSWWQRGAKGLRDRLFVTRAKKSTADVPRSTAPLLIEWPQKMAQLNAGNNAIVVTIADNGHGIPEEKRDQLFLPFFTTKEKGTGLGLALCHKVIQEHRGTIHVQSQAGKGTIFTIVFPL
jgi:signal transduction histidine kinase